MGSLAITLLVDSQSVRPDLCTEYGLSFFVQRDDGIILFDTGASGAWLANARTLGLPVEQIRHVVLSHGHRDHTGGIQEVLQVAPGARVCLHPRALAPHFSLHPGAAPRDLTLPAAAWQALRPMATELRWTTAPMRIAAGVGITGPIPRRYAQERSSGPFYLDGEGREEDPFEEDQALWIQTRAGLVVLLGCAHAGVANTLDYVRKITGEGRIRALIGGLHLARVDRERLAFTDRKIRAAGVQEVLTCHCTGEAVAAELGYHWMKAGHQWLCTDC